MNLKELRINANKTQSEIAEIIKVHTPEISNAENDIGYLQLEDIMILQNHFSRKIDLKEDLTAYRKHEVVQSIINLCEKYPIPVIAEFLGRTYRREVAADSLVIHYGKVADEQDVTPLYPL